MAATKPLIITGFTGVRNDVPAEDMRLASDAGTDLVAAVNVDVNDAGALSRRSGFTQQAAGTDMHSLFASKDGKTVLVVDGDKHYRLGADGQTLQLVGSGLTPGAPMTYWEHQGRIYLCNGHETGVYEPGSGSRTWGIRRPANPVLRAAAGGLVPGRYAVVCTYHDTFRGLESGAAEGADIVLESPGGIAVELVASTNPRVTHIAIYATAPDGSVFFRAAFVPNATGTYTLSGPLLTGQRPLITQHFDKPPAGHLCAVYRGRAYVAQGPNLHWSAPFGMELFRPLDFMQFTSDVRMVAPTIDGLFVSDAEGTYFLAGTDPTKFDVTTVGAPAQAGSLAYAPAARMGDGSRDIEVPVWVAADGVAVGSPGGAVTLVNRNFRPDPADRSAGLVRKAGETFQYLASTGV